MPPDTAKVNKLFELCLSFSSGSVPPQLEQLANEAIIISQKKSYRKGTGLGMFVKGFHYYGLRQYQKALDTIDHASRILEIDNDITNMGHCYFTLAHINYDMGNYPKAVSQSEAALARWKQSGYTALNGVCNNDMALAYIRMGNYSKAVEFAHKAYRACQALSDKKGMAQSLHLKGSAFFEFKNYENAFKNFEAAAMLNLSIKDSFAFARNNNMLGEIYLEQNNYPEALKRFNESFDIFSKPGAPPWGRPWGYSNIGSVYEKKGDSLQQHGSEKEAAENYAVALESYLRSLDKFQEIKDPAGSTEQMMLLGRVYFKTNNFHQAKKYLTQGLLLASQIGEKRHLASSYLFLSKTDSAEGNIPLSLQHYKMHILYRDSVYNLQSLQSLLALKAQEDVDRKDNEIALLETEYKLQKALSEKRSQGRNFAYLLAALFLALGTYGYFRFRKQSKIKAEQKLLKERLAISQDLHDSIGSTLSSIAVYSQVAKIHGTSNEYQNMNELLEKISKASGETVAEMNDIVWALNPRNDSMEKILQRMESFARPLAAARNIQFLFNTDTALHSQQLDMNMRKNFYLVFKEAVNNAVKYSAATQIKADIAMQKNKILMTIADNGIGFSVDSALKNNSSLAGNGLANIYKRTEEIKGSITIDSRPGKGTTVSLSFPVSLL